MPKSLSQVKHKESKPSCRPEARRKMEHNPGEIGSLQKFYRVATISQPAEFRNLPPLVLSDPV